MYGVKLTTCIDHSSDRERYVFLTCTALSIGQNDPALAHVAPPPLPSTAEYRCAVERIQEEMNDLERNCLILSHHEQPQDCKARLIKSCLSTGSSKH